MEIGTFTIAVASCLAASLLFALRKFRIDMEPVRAVATVAVTRNAQSRLRIGHIDVDLHPAQPAGQGEQLRRALDQFESFCIVTQSVRAGIPVDVRVIDRNGAVLKQPETAGEPA